MCTKCYQRATEAAHRATLVKDRAEALLKAPVPVVLVWDSVGRFYKRVS